MSDDLESDLSPASPDESAEMTPEQRAEAKAYGHWELFCGLADRALDVVYLAVMAFFFARPLAAWLARSTALPEGAMWRLLALLACVYLLHMAVSLPLAFFSGYVVEHRFGLSRLSLGRWIIKYLKLNALGLVFGAATFAGLYWLIWLTGSWWWLVAAAAAFVLSILLGQLVPVLIVPLFYRVERLEDDTLAPRLDRIAEGTGLEIEGVYRLDLSAETVKANAMLAGLGRTRRVLLGDTLLSKFTPEEIEVIFGHEVGHHVFRHIPKLIAFGALYSLIGFWLADRLLMAYVHRFDPALTRAEMPVWTLPLLMLLITLFSLVMEPLRNAVSRHFERQCDRYALERTGHREAYRSAFHKLAKLNKDDPDPHPLEVFWLHSHPPISERLAMAEVGH